VRIWIKLQVSFAEYCHFYRALLQKRPINLSISVRMLTLISIGHSVSMGWRRSVASIKFKVSFADYRLFYRALLQKRPIILSILLTKATPYHTSGSNYRSLLQNIVTFIGFFCKRDLSFYRSYYGVATISRLLKIIGLFCRISSLLQNIVSFAEYCLFCRI